MNTPFVLLPVWDDQSDVQVQLDEVRWIAGEGPNEENLIAGPSATASSEMAPAANAVDGDAGSRWESNHGVDPSWLVVDLGSTYSLEAVQIAWEAANAKDYEVQGSNTNNGSDWALITSSTGGTFGNRTDTLDLSGSYRYLRIYGISRSDGNAWGYSIFEVRVYGVAE